MKTRLPLCLSVKHSVVLTAASILRCFGMLLFFFAAPSYCLAGGWYIYHKTTDSSMDMKLLYPEPTQEEQEIIDKDCEKRMDVGLAETILLEIRGIPESEAKKTVWKISGVEHKAAGFFSDAGTNNSSTNIATTSASAEEMLENQIKNESNEMPQTYTGKKTLLNIDKTKTYVASGLQASVTISATLLGREETLKFFVYRPTHFKGKNYKKSYTEIGSIDKRFYMSVEITMIAAPIKVSFSKLHFRELNRNTPREKPLKLKPLPAAETFWGDFHHKTGESDGSAPPMVPLEDGAGSFWLDGVQYSKEERKKVRIYTSEEVRKSIDENGTHSFEFRCGFFVYKSADESRQDVHNPLAPMRPMLQKFKLGKVNGNYYCEIQKFGTTSRKTIYDNDDKIEFYYHNSEALTEDLTKDYNPNEEYDPNGP